jgi:hypothetical protein
MDGSSPRFRAGTRRPIRTEGGGEHHGRLGIAPLACGPDCPRPNWLPGWAPASPPSPDWRAARPYRAPRRWCATRRRRAASSTCGFRRPDAAISGCRPRNRTKSYSGAPRSTKMGNIASPWHYDIALEPTPVPPNPRPSRRRLYAGFWLAGVHVSGPLCPRATAETWRIPGLDCASQAFALYCTQSIT